jgi:hypothetical protein
MTLYKKFTFTSGVATQTGSNDASHFFLINSMSHCSILGNSFKSDGHIGTCPISHTACVTPFSAEMLYLLPTLPSIRFTPRNTAPVLRKLNGPFHFYREWRCIKSLHSRQALLPKPAFQSHFFLINSMSHCSILGNSFKSDDHIGTCPISHTTCVTPFSGSNDACSLRQITWSINEKAGVSAGMEMTRKYRIDPSLPRFYIHFCSL